MAELSPVSNGANGTPDGGGMMPGFSFWNSGSEVMRPGFFNAHAGRGSLGSKGTPLTSGRSDVYDWVRALASNRGVSLIGVVRKPFALLMLKPIVMADAVTGA